ncbi:hypothetical protein ATANTOWER_006730, partial [Ataeniobius toweri]|nr:hypothetical protein [Ataeniobius toweri]
PWFKPSSFSSLDDTSFQTFKFSLSNQAPADSLKPPWTHWPPEPNLAHPPSCTPPTKFFLRQTTTKDQYCTSNFTTGDPSTSAEQTPTGDYTHHTHHQITYFVSQSSSASFRLLDSNHLSSLPE